MSKDSPPPEPKLPETVSAETLAELTGLDVRRIYQLRDEKKIPAPAKRGGGFPLAESLRGILAAYQAAARGDSAAKARDAARREKAEADGAQLNTAKLWGLLMLRSDARRAWRDGFVKIRLAVLNTPGASPKFKADLTARLAKIEPEWLEKDPKE